MDQNIVELFRKYMAKQCSRAELEKVLLIIETGSFLEEWEHALSQDADLLFETEDGMAKRNELSRLKLHHRLIDSINETSINETSIIEHEKTIRPGRLRVILKRIAVPVAASILVCLGWWLFQHQNNGMNETKEQIVYENDIAPGKYGATLRLGNGEEISLNGSKSGVVIKDSHLSYNDGTELVLAAQSSAKERYTAITDIGSTYMLTLSDGTQVWLNAGSQLSFPAHFDTKSRMVSLKGEAFFKVAKDKSHPFIVESGNQQVKVLGTEFNVNSYADELATKTTLVEGSVQITSANNNYVLKPGQQSTLASNGTLAVSEVDTTLATAWKNNKFIFENNDIESVMRMIKRWYDVEVIYSGPMPEVTFGGKVSRFSNVSGVLRVLEITGGVHFKIEGRKIYVFK